MLPALGASYHAHYNRLLQTELHITSAQKQALALSWGSAVIPTGYHDFICGVAVCMPMSCSHRVVVQPRFVSPSCCRANLLPTPAWARCSVRSGPPAPLALAALAGSRAAAPEAPAALARQHGLPTTRSARVRGARPMIGARASACLGVARLLLALLFWAAAAAPASGSQVLRCQVWRSGAVALAVLPQCQPASIHRQKGG